MTARNGSSRKRGLDDVDAVILGIEKTKDFTSQGIPRSFVIGMRNGNKYRIIGEVGTGLSNKERKQIAADLKPISPACCSRRIRREDRVERGILQTANSRRGEIRKGHSRASPERTTAHPKALGQGCRTVGPVPDHLGWARTSA